MLWRVALTRKPNDIMIDTSTELCSTWSEITQETANKIVN